MGVTDDFCEYCEYNDESFSNEFSPDSQNCQRDYPSFDE